MNFLRKLSEMRWKLFYLSFKVKKENKNQEGNKSLIWGKGGIYGWSEMFKLSLKIKKYHWNE